MIKLIENYFVDADEMQYILKQSVTRQKKNSDETYSAENIIGYYPSMKSTVNALITIIARKAIINNEVSDLKEYIKQIETTTNKLLDYLK